MKPVSRRSKSPEGRALAMTGTVVLHGVGAGLLFARPGAGPVHMPGYAVRPVAGPAAPDNRPPATDGASPPV